MAGFKGKNSKNTRLIILSYMICLISLLFLCSHHNTFLIHRIIHRNRTQTLHCRVCVFFKKNNKIKTKLRSDLPWNYHKVVYVDDWLPCIFFISLYTEFRKIEANTLALLCFAVLFPIQINTFEILFRFILLLFRIHLVYTCVYVFSEVFFRYSVPFYRNDTFEARL